MVNVYKKYCYYVFVLFLFLNVSTKSFEHFLPFDDFCGFSERYFKNNLKGADLYLQQLREILKGSQGTFFLHKVEPFSDTISKKDVNNTSKIAFTVLIGNNFVDKKNVDIAALQADPQNKNALFQVASNLDCLEADGGKKFHINDYVAYKTQGEIAVLSALPGIIDRMYLQPDIRLLKNFVWNGKRVPLSAGYFPYYSLMEEQFGSMTKDDILNAASRVCVGVQHNVHVVSGARKSCMMKKDGFYCLHAQKINDHTQVITQVLTAALDPYYNDTSTQGYKNFARVLLHAAYKGTLDVARILGIKKIYLTLVGGGVFKNDYSWISEAIVAAVNDFACHSSVEGTQIILIIYSLPSVQEKKWNTFYQDIIALSEKYKIFEK